MLIRNFGANILNKGDTTFIVVYCKHAILYSEPKKHTKIFVDIQSTKPNPL